MTVSRRLGLVFFAINFTASVAFFIGCAVAVGESCVGGGSPFALLGGVMFAGPTLAFAVAEWRLYVRDVRGLERLLGAVCGLVGFMTILAFVSNLIEAVVKGDKLAPAFWLVFGAVCLGVALYSLTCGWYRLRRQTGRAPVSPDLTDAAP